MAVLRNGSKCSHTTCMLRFFTVSRLALNSNLIFEIGSNNDVINLSVSLRSLTSPCQKIFTIGTVFKYPHLFYVPGNEMMKGARSINTDLACHARSISYQS